MENWKNNRAEVSMRETGKEIMKKAAAKSKADEDAKWNELKMDLDAVKSPEMADTLAISWVIDLLRTKYELPIKLK